jgi:cell fate regulator YaaT (PSP1 superfamily)
VVLIIKLIFIVALKVVYFSHPVPFNANHLFGKSTAEHNIITTKISQPKKNSPTKVDSKKKAIMPSIAKGAPKISPT